MSRKRVVVYVQGGLGNQLFCYAIARSYSLRYNRRCLLDIHTGYTNDLYERKYRLNNFNLPTNIENEIPKRSIKNIISKFLPIKLRSFVKERYLGATNILNVKFIPSSIYFKGYWQDEKYFKSIKKTLVKELVPNIKLSLGDLKVLKRIKSTNSVFIHIRRVQYPHQLSLSYYERSVLHMKKQLENPLFFIFGDDMEWVKQQSIFKSKCVIVDHNNISAEMNDFMLMKSCKHAIIANSSFSWWAAWLNDDINQKVICPNQSGFALKMTDYWQKQEVIYPNFI